MWGKTHIGSSFSSIACDTYLREAEPNDCDTRLDSSHLSLQLSLSSSCFFTTSRENLEISGIIHLISFRYLPLRKDKACLSACFPHQRNSGVGICVSPDEFHPGIYSFELPSWPNFSFLWIRVGIHYGHFMHKQEQIWQKSPRAFTFSLSFNTVSMIPCHLIQCGLHKPCLIPTLFRFPLH